MGQALEVEDLTDLASVSRAISQLKGEMRALQAGKSTKARQKTLISDFINELEDARGRALRELDPDLQKELATIDRAYRDANERIYGSLLGDMVAKNPQGGYIIKDDNLFKKLASQPSELRQLNGLINSPEYAGFGGTTLVKDGFMKLYRDLVVDGTRTHKSFMNTYKDSMKEVFAPQEMKKFDNFASAQKNIDFIEKNRAAQLKRLNKSFDAKMQSYDPETILDKTKNSLTKVRRVKELLTPDQFDDYKKLYARDFLNSVMDDGTFGPEFSIKKLTDRISKDKGELRAVFGEDYVKHMQWVADLMQVRKMPKTEKGVLSELMKENPNAGPALMFWRGTVARPLSRAGLLTTSALKIMRSGSREALGKILENPNNLRLAYELYQKNANLRKWNSFLRAIGYNELADKLLGKDDE